ncbi:NAD(P)/FAD-dependent oxidoreductase [Thermotoga neapolitana]|uniref:NADH oxidase n=1 Tax=Thermotoga neapolitana (strain ATCC 49049 / DSM 4359 / NBRC 107923 / NS-E) TaxID=309803 RepID=B9KBQ4_THENN|nr:FAD-dependent oxidoreductase [Thermotoga neapolitana]ACM22450.1 NADH oxidase [Thermotoga neapolitana DSM 4359]KFZ22560.1 NADH oxidase [Thermotoga neapolitana LA10]HBF10271.1 NAD(P)/FAD-dependent oxidoreductase [Thermotoga neapolitana]
MRYIVVGSGPAGLNAIEAIRELDKDGEILLTTAEKYVGYSRPLITYLLGRKVTEEKMYYRTEDYLKEMGVSIKPATRVERVIPKEKVVVTSTGEKIAYDKLLLAVGGKPFVPKIEGLEGKEGVFTFTTWEDEERVERYIKENDVREAVVLGGGLIGLKTTEALMELGVKVTIVELADRILSVTFDKKASEIITNALKKEGCDVITNDTIVAVKGEGSVSSVVLKSGKEIPTRLLIIAIGVRPNVDFLKDSGIEINRGIVVNEKMETSEKDIYAAGDCTEFYDLIDGQRKTIAIWPVAVAQGRVAGYNMAGGNVRYPGGIPMNSVELAGIPTISVGHTNVEGDEYEILTYEEGNTYKKMVIKDNKLIGAVLVNDIDRAGIYTGLILQKMDVSSFKDKLLDENFGLVYLPKEFRKKMLEGEVKIWLE